MNDIICLEDSCVIIDEVTETVKHEIKKQDRGFLGVLIAISRFISADSNLFSSKRHK